MQLLSLHILYIKYTSTKFKEYITTFCAVFAVFTGHCRQADAWALDYYVKFICNSYTYRVHIFFLKT